MLLLLTASLWAAPSPLVSIKRATGDPAQPEYSTADRRPSFQFVQVAPGVRLRYAEMGDPAGDPVILLHGYSDSWFSWSRVMPALAGTRRVIALDLRGHGGSDQPADGYEMHQLADDVVAFMDSLGLDRATVVGHSMGTFVAQQVAARAPRRVSRLILVDGAAALSEVPGMSEFRDSIHTLPDPVPEEFARAFQVSTIHLPVGDAFLDEVVRTSLVLEARVWRALIDGMLAMKPATGLATLNIPTLILWGEKDAIIPREATERLGRMIPGSSTVIYRETGHAPHWERPEQFIRDFEAFVSGRTS